MTAQVGLVGPRWDRWWDLSFTCVYNNLHEIVPQSRQEYIFRTSQARHSTCEVNKCSAKLVHRTLHLFSVGRGTRASISSISGFLSMSWVSPTYGPTGPAATNSSDDRRRSFAALLSNCNQSEL